MDEIDSIDIARRAVNSAREKKAEDIRALFVREVTPLADYFIVCTGNTARQTKAIADEVEYKLRAAKVHPLHVEGLREGRWVLMDYGDVVVHVFEAEAREYYNLEGLWADAVEIDL